MYKADPDLEHCNPIHLLKISIPSIAVLRTCNFWRVREQHFRYLLVNMNRECECECVGDRLYILHVHVFHAFMGELV